MASNPQSSRKLAKIARRTFKKQQSEFWGSALRPVRWYRPFWAIRLLTRYLFK